VINIQTPDVAGFERSQSQIAAQMGRLLGQGQRNR
jgi:cell division protein FtsW (lipid II flippase)